MLDMYMLRSFTMAAELGSLSRVATALGIAQSAVSRHLHALETEVGGRVFHRTGRGVTLTEVGMALLPQAQAILSGVQAMVDDARQVRVKPSGTVSIGLVPAWSHLLVARLLTWQGTCFPDIRLRIMEGYSGDIQEWLSSGQIDVGMFNHYRAMRAADTLVSNPMQLIARADNGRFSNAQTLKVLGQIPLALPMRPNGLRSVLDAWCQRLDIPLDIRLEANSSVAIKHAVLHGGLFSVLPRHAILHEARAGLLKGIPLVEPQICQNTFLETSCHKPLTAAAREVWRILPGLVKAAQA